MGRLIAFVAVVIAVALVSMRSSRRHGGGRLRPGPGAIGTVYDLLNEEKRNAIEIILEQKAEARDPERATGNLPELEHPDKR